MAERGSGTKSASGRWVLGLDEAGRGAAFGPMVVAGVALDPLKAGALTRLGVRDSKQFGAGDAARTHRRALTSHIERLSECIVIRVLHAAEVDRYAEAGDLNVLERRAADEILRDAGPVHRVVADGQRLFQALRQDSKLEEELSVVPTVEDLQLNVGIELAHLPNLPVLGSYQALFHGGQFHVEPELRQVEIGREASGDPALGITVQGETDRLVTPLDPVEVEEAGEIGLTLVSEVKFC